ncbi:MAG: RND transporter [Methylocystaceae bacterium]|nr:MAG: RND transporter [Methylocystaceae bacterium]
MNLATWSIRNPVPSILLFLMMTAAGFYGFRTMPIQGLPDIELPAVNVSLTLPGAAPAQLEMEVARKVENSIASISGVKHMNTSITDGLVTINIQFILEKPVSDALIETKDAVDSVRADMPTDLQLPTVTAIRSTSNPLITYAISSPRMDEEALSWFTDDTLSRLLLALPGVGKFERIGGVSREARVEVDPAKLASLGVTAAGVSHALGQVQMEASGGRGQIGRLEQGVRTIATVRQASDLDALPIALGDGRFVRLDQLATISDTHAERTQAASLDGRPVVGFRVFRAKGADETRVASAVEKALDDLQRARPDLSIAPISNTVDYTLDQYRGSMHMLYEGALLAVIVVWLFLRDWRATLISAVALPLSIIPTFAAMYWLGFSLNTLTLLSQAVVVGILVDDAIVEIENIVRHKRMGKPVLRAAEDAVTEIALAVIATTMALVVVFLPTSLMGGVSGLFFRQFGWTIVISVLASLLVARLLTPMMAVYFLRDEEHAEPRDGRMMNSYLAMVRWALVHRGATIALTIAFFIGSGLLGKFLAAGFVPPSDRGFTIVSLELPPGSSLQDTLAASEAARRAIAEVDGVSHVFTAVGVAQAAGRGGVTQAGEVRNGSMTVTFLPRDQRRAQTAIEKDIRRNLERAPGARFTLSTGNAGEKMSVILSSDNSQALDATARELVKQMRGVAFLANINSSANLERPEIHIRPNAARAAELGVTTAAIGETVRVATAGAFNMQLPKLNLDNRQVYIRVQLPDQTRQDLDTIANLRVPARNGFTSLETVADISIGAGPAQISRYDRQRFVTVNADLGGAPLGEALARIKALPAIENMPSSVRLIESGDAEMMAELFSNFGLAILTGVMCVFCVLVLLFGDFFQPLTILSALPLSLGGSIIALLAARQQLSLPALIGIVMLMGVVSKNSILLAEYAIVGIRDRGMSRYDALIDACHKRARPIVMTTIAMIAGMTPIALGFGGDSSFRQPMAIAVIGGLVTSTALSLLVVPVVFTYVDGLERRLRRFLPLRNIHVIHPARAEIGSRMASEGE